MHAFPSLQAFVLFEKTHPVAVSQPSVVHGLPSLHAIVVPAHAPPPHASPDVQLLPSSQGLPLFAWTQPVAGLQPSLVHGLASSQTTAVPPQDPAVQTSPWVQRLPSLQAVPFAFGGLEHTEVPASQTPASWQESNAPQMTGAPLVQMPAWQVSDRVHALPSSHRVPSATEGSEQSTRVLTATEGG